MFDTLFSAIELVTGFPVPVPMLGSVTPLGVLASLILAHPIATWVILSYSQFVKYVKIARIFTYVLTNYWMVAVIVTLGLLQVGLKDLGSPKSPMEAAIYDTLSTGLDAAKTGAEYTKGALEKVDSQLARLESIVSGTSARLNEIHIVETMPPDIGRMLEEKDRIIAELEARIEALEKMIEPPRTEVVRIKWWASTTRMYTYCSVRLGNRTVTDSVWVSRLDAELLKARERFGSERVNFRFVVESRDGVQTPQSVRDAIYMSIVEVFPETMRSGVEFR